MKRILMQIGLALLLVLSIPVGAAAGVFVFFAAAHLTDSVALLSLAGAATLVLVTGVISALASAGLIPHGRAAQRWLPASVTGGSLVLVGLFWAGLVLEPMEYPYLGMEPTEQTRYWELPTGSRLAYVVTRAEAPTERPPVIWLHGGPGAPDGAGPRPEDRLLAAEGFDVYRYHQVGAGLSDRLEDVTGYTVQRHVDDLEAIREEIGAERMILIGGSWGATLAAHYIAAHPDRVEQVVFAGPGAIWQPAWSSGEIPSDGSDMALIAEAVTPRFGAIYYLHRINPSAAHSLASDEEVSGFFQRVLGRIIASDVDGCGEGQAATERTAETLIPPGYGFYAMMGTWQSQNQVEDPRPMLRQVEIPALVVRGECDRIRPEIALEYARVFRNSRLVLVEGAAHSVAGSPAFPEILRAFLLEDLAVEPDSTPPGSRSRLPDRSPAAPWPTP